VGRAPSEPSLVQPVGERPLASNEKTPQVAFAETMTPNLVGATDDLSMLPPVSPELYTVGFQIAQGGMGKIYAARDRKLRRDIVLKTLVEGAPVGRFEREALITARLQHPSIVRVYDAGKLRDEPFYAMEYVRGTSLDKVVAAADDAEARLALLPHVIAVADALAYAHTEGVIHRDLKPANVLVGSFGETVVIDWGLAKDTRGLLEDSLEPQLPPASLPAQPVGALGSSDLTVAGAVMGTPSYMPPEQARGEGADERSDVYAIGAILYTVLAGTPPITGARALDDARAGGITPLRDRAPETPDELVTIVEHAMSFDPRERYSSARELAEDLRRYSTGKLVARHSYSTRDLIRRWLRKNKTPVAIAGTVVLGLLILSTIWVRGIAAERDHATDELELARTTLDRVETTGDDLAIAQAERVLAVDPTTSIAWLARLSPKGLERPRARELADSAAARGVAFELAGPRGAITQLVVAQPVGAAYTAGSDGQLFRWRLGTFKGEPLGAHRGPVTTLASSFDGFWLATGGEDGAVEIWDLESVHDRKGAHHAAKVRAVVFSPDGNSIASTGDDGAVWSWSVLKGDGRALYKDAQPLTAIAWGATAIYAGRADGKVIAIDAATGKTLATLETHNAEVRVLALSPDGTYLASGSRDGSVIVWTLADSKRRALATHADGVRDLVWTASNQLITAGGDPAIHIHDLAAAKTFDLAGNPSAVNDLAVSATEIAAACADGKLRVWPLTGGNPTRTLIGHRVSVAGVAFTIDGKKLLSIADDRVRLWPLDPVAPAPPGKDLATWLASRSNLTIAK